MFPIVTVCHYTRNEYLTQITKNKTLPVVKTKNWNLPMRNKS